jgi:uncharacterized membrane protein
MAASNPQLRTSRLHVPGWASPVAAVLTVAGIGVAIYLTIAHYDTHIALACASKGVVNCEQVTTSAQSKVFGIPVAVLGLAYFVGMLPWHLPAAWRSADPRVRFGRLIYAAAGIAFVFYLVYAEAVIIKKICLWCTAVHVITLLLFVLTVFATALSYPARAEVAEPDEVTAEP